MALLRPSLADSICIDVSHDNIITFSVHGGDQFVGYSVQIVDSSNRQVYSATKTTYSNSFNLQAGTNGINNGNEYKIRFQTIGIDGSTSGYSDYMIMYCYSTPVCVIPTTNLPIDVDLNDRVVNAQNYTFEAEYSQAESVPIKSYQFFIYTADKELLHEYSVVFTSSAKFTQTVEGFSANTEYYIEVRVTDFYDRTVSSGLIHFTVFYEKPRIQQHLDLFNNKEQAAVECYSSLIQIIFKSDNEEVQYIDGQELDLRNNRIHLDEQIDLAGNFTMKLYLRDIPRKENGDDEYFFTMNSIDGKIRIKLKEYGNRIHAYKIFYPQNGINEIVSHYVSDIIPDYIPEESYVLIQINHTDNRLDIRAIVTERIA